MLDGASSWQFALFAFSVKAEDEGAASVSRVWLAVIVNIRCLFLLARPTQAAGTGPHTDVEDSPLAASVCYSSSS